MYCMLQVYTAQFEVYTQNKPPSWQKGSQSTQGEQHLDGLILHLIFITGFKYVGMPVVCHIYKVSNKGY